MRKTRQQTALREQEGRKDPIGRQPYSGCWDMAPAVSTHAFLQYSTFAGTLPLGRTLPSPAKPSKHVQAADRRPHSTLGLPPAPNLSLGEVS